MISACRVPAPFCSGQRSPSDAQVQPGGAHRPAHLELVEYHADDAGDGLVGMEADLPVVLAPDQADGQAAAELAAGGLVLDAAFEPGPEHVELVFGHHPLHAQHQPVVEQGGMVDAVGVGDEGVADPGQVQKPVPGGVVPREPGDLQRQDDPDLAEGDLGEHALEPVPLPGHRPADSQVAVDDPDRAGGPAQLPGAGGQVVLAGRGLGVALHLGEGGLADVDDRGPRQVRGGDLIAHRRPPSRPASWRSGPPAARRPR